MTQIATDERDIEVRAMVSMKDKVMAAIVRNYSGIIPRAELHNMADTILCEVQADIMKTMEAW